MIKVEERLSNRVPGATSLFISFTYDSRYISLIKDCDVYDYNKKTREWEIPIKGCHVLLDLLSVYDDIEITTLDTDIDYQNVELISTFKSEPRHFQLDAVKFGLTHPHMLLMDDMGCIDGDAEVSVNYALLPTSKYTSTHKMKLSEFYTLYNSHKDIKFSIRTLKDDGWFGNCPVSKVVYSGYKQTYKLELEDGRFVCATPDHLILTKNGYKRVDELDINNDLVASNGTPLCKHMVPKYLKIKSITDSGYKDVYDVSVDDPCHNFIANKIVVHNCGKTASSIYLAQELKNRGLIEHCLVICGVDSLRTNWKREIAKHSNLSCRVLGEHITSRGNVTYETIKKRNEELVGSIDEFFIVTNISHIRSEEFVDAFNVSKTKIDMIIVDELHKCNNATTSQQGKNLMKLHAKYQMGLSGTLMTKDALSFYAPLMWITNNDLTVASYKKYYCVYDEDDADKTFPVGYKNLDVLHENLMFYGLRRTKQLPEIASQLPPKTIIDEYVDMTDEHQKVYKDVTSKVHKEVDRVKIYGNNPRALIVRLRQASTCPNVLTSKNIISSKITRCVEMVENLIDSGEKVVVFTTFKEVVHTLGELLKQYNPYLVTGDDSVTYVDTATDNFQKDPSKKLLIATQQKLGTGVTLNAARYLIFVDCPWTNFEYAQATDRVHRIGSKDPVFIYNLICPNTIDEAIANAINRRRKLSQWVEDGIPNETYHNEEFEIIRGLIQD